MKIIMENGQNQGYDFPYEAEIKPYCTHSGSGGWHVAGIRRAASYLHPWHPLRNEVELQGAL